ncbi:hypothetical protein SAMN02745196_01029 [Clostridium collagenovorans DSM 3089]|uniref:histidine kinase n=1 Tax=Clostridium collagenovorans DSM 3089 TaxID=1121306 RepID=A0A1M5V086_9CLOT|nr:sensor histidine kinase [Clostridium collagenovorans]SHH68651.1 hypothetical protein SAMN02745196_01029 [Clostridium collagenovorans DSM 3089]
MRLKYYLQNKVVHISMYIVLMGLIQFMLYMFKVPSPLMISILILMLTFIILEVTYDYNRKKDFFNEFLENLDQLDKKYLITEIIKKPNFIEGKIIYESLQDINKNIYEEIEQYKNSVSDFKEYIEMWIHEVKIPIASSVLILHNNKPDTVKKVQLQINRIESYVEQVLYYVRSKNAEKDYLIKQCNLKEIINSVVRKNKDILISKHIAINVEDVSESILSDSKWLEFIINQIISNSIKYSKDESPKISFRSESKEGKIILHIEDNGLGINKSDLPRVFNKSFTGENGRGNSSSTGMGLYLCKKLCNKIGHFIEVNSEKNIFTRVSITFNCDEYYKDVR